MRKKIFDMDLIYSKDRFTTREAIEYIKDKYGRTLTRATIANWVNYNGIGIKVGKRLVVDKKELDDFLREGDF